jgi:hypothetical protein
MPRKPTPGQRVNEYRPNKTGVKTRISEHIKVAIHEMIYNGRTRKQAAEIAKIKDDSLYKILLKPDVLKYKNEIMRVFRESESERSFTKIVTLRDEAESQRVQLDAAKTIASMDDRFQPGQKITHAGTIGVKAVGYIIDLRDIDQDEPARIDRALAVDASIDDE